MRHTAVSGEREPEPLDRESGRSDLATRGIWLALAVLAAALVGSVGGLLSWIGGMNPAQAILAGAASFGATTILLLKVIRFVTEQTG
jgi:hypothetical protein